MCMCNSRISVRDRRTEGRPVRRARSRGDDAARTHARMAPAGGLAMSLGQGPARTGQDEPALAELATSLALAPRLLATAAVIPHGQLTAEQARLTREADKHGAWRGVLSVTARPVRGHRQRRRRRLAKGELLLLLLLLLPACSLEGPAPTGPGGLGKRLGERRALMHAVLARRDDETGNGGRANLLAPRHTARGPQRPVARNGFPERYVRRGRNDVFLFLASPCSACKGPTTSSSRRPFSFFFLSCVGVCTEHCTRWAGPHARSHLVPLLQAA